MIFESSLFLIQLLTWFDQNRRDLPWRAPRNAAPGLRLDPYLVFVSEAMLQQTQVSTVVPYFNRFRSAFPTIEALANATEQKVLRMWQGLGYYSRARNLQKAAKKILEEFGGVVPDSVEDLLKLPGVGRYTAGAIASIAYDRRAPVLDGNVARVLCRIDRVESDPRETATREKLWQRAAQILPNQGERVGDFNSALMELGATVCTPRNPQCLICPVRDFCRAFADGVQDRIPAPRKAKQTPLEKRWTFCIRHRDRYLIEQRPSTGRWAGMWQFITIQANGTKPTASLLKRTFGLSASPLQRAGQLSHTLTHRRYHFDVFSCQATDRNVFKADHSRKWVRLSDLDHYPLPRPHLKVLEMLKFPPGKAVTA
jgi:A/G-specific adenine glycosylase